MAPEHCSVTPPESTPEAILDFVSLGMFILDKIEYGPSNARQTVDNIIGGAGTYSVIGARLFSPAPLSKRIGWIVDTGSDFPQPVSEQLDSLDMAIKFRFDPQRLTTRGLNIYGPGDYRSFEYITQKKRLEVQDLLDHKLLSTNMLHLICSPQRAQTVCDGLVKLCELGRMCRGKVIWEPVPDLCTPEHQHDLYKTLQKVDVISPNHTELASFFGISDPLDVEHPDVIRKLGGQLIGAGIGAEVGAGLNGCAVIRAGRKGCLVCTVRNPLGTWLPAYYSSTRVEKSIPPRAESAVDGLECREEENHPKVVDPTGGGNTFIGGFAMGWVREKKNALKAAAWGIVAASFAIEQIGIPRMEKTEDGEERWNGVKVMERLEEYMKICEELGVRWEEEEEYLRL